MARGAGQDRFLGSLMGMAIGDAMGMRVAGWPAARIAERYAGGNSADEALLASAALAAAGDRIGSEALAQRAFQLGATGPAVEALRGSAALSFTAPMR